MIPAENIPSLPRTEEDAMEDARARRKRPNTLPTPTKSKSFDKILGLGSWLWVYWSLVLIHGSNKIENQKEKANSTLNHFHCRFGLWGAEFENVNVSFFCFIALATSIPATRTKIFWFLQIIKFWFSSCPTPTHTRQRPAMTRVSRPLLHGRRGVVIVRRR